MICSLAAISKHATGTKNTEPIFFSKKNNFQLKKATTFMYKIASILRVYLFTLTLVGTFAAALSNNFTAK